jgi:hypothetical protein
MDQGRSRGFCVDDSESSEAKIFEFFYHREKKKELKITLQDFIQLVRKKSVLFPSSNIKFLIELSSIAFEDFEGFKSDRSIKANLRSLQDSTLMLRAIQKTANIYMLDKLFKAGYSFLFEEESLEYFVDGLTTTIL